MKSKQPFKRNRALEKYMLMWGNARISNAVYVLGLRVRMWVGEGWERKRGMKGKKRKRKIRMLQKGNHDCIWVVRSSFSYIFFSFFQIFYNGYNF